jgi:hypothetical protein
MASLIFKMAAWRPQNRSNRENKKSSGRIAQKGILTPSFIEIAPAVMKRALLTDDDDDGHHVIKFGYFIESHSGGNKLVVKKQNFRKNSYLDN